MGGSKIVDEPADHMALKRGQDAGEHHVERIACPSRRRSENPVDRELRFAERQGLACKRDDARLDSDEEADRVLDARGRALATVHVDEPRDEAPLANGVELEVEGVAEICEHRVQERLGGALQVEDLRPAVDVGYDQVGDLLEHRDEGPQVLALFAAQHVAGQHREQVETAAGGSGRSEPAEAGAGLCRWNGSDSAVSNGLYTFEVLRQPTCSAPRTLRSAGYFWQTQAVDFHGHVTVGAQNVAMMFAFEN